VNADQQANALELVDAGIAEGAKVGATQVQLICSILQLRFRAAAKV